MMGIGIGIVPGMVAHALGVCVLGGGGTMESWYCALVMKGGWVYPLV